MDPEIRPMLVLAMRERSHEGIGNESDRNDDEQEHEDSSEDFASISDHGWPP
jgi:hypothetical protein